VGHAANAGTPSPGVPTMAAYELKSFIHEIYETSGMTKNMILRTRILNIAYIDSFSNNGYVFELNERGTTKQESTSLVYKEKNKEATIPSKLGKSGIFHLHHQHVIITLKPNML
jgi:hypothetical protein